MTVFVQAYPDGTELCPQCWQPDNCGDCNHQPLSKEDVEALGGKFIPLEDTVCVCGHWYEEHDLPLGGAPSDAFCAAPGCSCESYEYSPSASTPSAIADRGGDPDLWPDHVKQAFKEDTP